MTEVLQLFITEHLPSSCPLGASAFKSNRSQLHLCKSLWTHLRLGALASKSPVHRNRGALRAETPQCLILFPFGRDALQAEVVCSSPGEQRLSLPFTGSPPHPQVRNPTL